MDFQIIARTVPVVKNDKIVTDGNLINDFKNVSGLCANVCYSKGYDKSTIDSKLIDYEVNSKRFERVISTGHHSIADHASATVYLGGISKALAMLLNSLRCYTTSERSARYTNVSESCSSEERRLYDKWKNIIFDCINNNYTNIDEKRAVKLAMENARYMVSVFAKATSMAYTASYRQWSYIVNWCDKAIEEWRRSGTDFQKKLIPELQELRSFICGEDMLDGNVVDDIKNRKFEFFGDDTDDCTNVYGRNYSIAYSMSFACLAQLQRHRTLEYTIDLTYADCDKQMFYIPEIIKSDPKLIDEWLCDINSVAGLYPQGMMVKVRECGRVEDLILKAKERLCGRAQLEAMLSTKYVLDEIWKNADDSIKKYLYEYRTEKNEWKAKCQMLNGCMEPCEFAGSKAFTRNI